MANKLEKDLGSQDIIDVEQDYIRMLDAMGVSYKNPFQDVAKAMLEDYAFDGSGTSVKQAINNQGQILNSHGQSIYTLTQCALTPEELTLLEEMLNIS